MNCIKKNGEDHGYIDRNSCLAVTHYWCTYLFGYRVSSKANLEQTNIENAQKLYLKYEQINQELTHKIDQKKKSKTAKTYQEEVLVYQGKLATAQRNGIFAGRKSGAERIAASESSAWDA